MKQNNSNLIGAYMDFCAGCVQLWIRSAEPPGDIVMRIETQQQQSGLAIDGCTTPRSATIDTFR